MYHCHKENHSLDSGLLSIEGKDWQESSLIATEFCREKIIMESICLLSNFKWESLFWKRLMLLCFSRISSKREDKSSSKITIICWDLENLGVLKNWNLGVIWFSKLYASGELWKMKERLICFRYQMFKRPLSLDKTPINILNSLLLNIDTFVL